MTGQKISSELLDTIGRLLPESRQQLEIELVQATPETHAVAEAVIAKIPKLIADGIVRGRDYAQVCMVFPEFEEEHDRLKAHSKLSAEEIAQLQFALPDAASRALAYVSGQKPEPHYLRSAARLIWAYCEKNDLRPGLTPYEFFRFWTHGPCCRDVCYSWIIIRWQPEHINKLLRVRIKSTAIGIRQRIDPY